MHNEGLLFIRRQKNSPLQGDDGEKKEEAREEKRKEVAQKKNLRTDSKCRHVGNDSL